MDYVMRSDSDVDCLRSSVVVITTSRNWESRAIIGWQTDSRVHSYTAT